MKVPFLDLKASYTEIQDEVESAVLGSIRSGQYIGGDILETFENSFKNFVDFFYQHKEGMLHTQLYNNVRLISFKEGEVTLNTELINDTHFNRTVAKLISKWTGRIWQIHSSTSNVGKSLYEEDLINQQKEIDKMKNHPEIKQILELFPGVTIHSITDITETTDEKNLISINRKEKEV